MGRLYVYKANVVNATHFLTVAYLCQSGTMYVQAWNRYRLHVPGCSDPS